VRWVVTLHSPHGGSELGRAPNRFGTAFMDGVDFGPANDLRDNIRNTMNAALQPLTNMVNNPAQQELAPGSPLLTNLAAGEGPRPFVTYLTFGGTSPTFVKVYAWNFTADSALPLPTR